MQPIYSQLYLPVLAMVVALGAAGLLPRVGHSTAGEGTERRYFYGTVWAVTLAQTILLVLWKTLPRTHTTDVLKLAVYVVLLALLGTAAAKGLFPRTRAILPGEMVVAD